MIRWRSRNSGETDPKKPHGRYSGGGGNPSIAHYCLAFQFAGRRGRARLLFECHQKPVHEFIRSRSFRVNSFLRIFRYFCLSWESTTGLAMKEKLVTSYNILSYKGVSEELFPPEKQKNWIFPPLLPFGGLRNVIGCLAPDDRPARAKRPDRLQQDCPDGAAADWIEQSHPPG